MVGIEAMLHQVRVPDSDCSFAHFLRWLYVKLSGAIELKTLVLMSVIHAACASEVAFD